MPAHVTLKATQGKLSGQQFAFAERTTCVLGRADDCRPQVPNDADHRTISRHHCLLDINPPDIRVRDFGSRNGTFVNGKKIGQREKGMTPEEGARMTFPEQDLKYGDEIRLSHTVFRVEVFQPALCPDCGVELPDINLAQAETIQEIPLCAACRQKADVARKAASSPKRSVACAHCGRSVADEVGPLRQGEFVCTACQADPERIVQSLLEKSRCGDRNLLAIQGYEVLRELDRGGMGAVYLARHAQTGEVIALKIMLPQVAMQERAKEQFLREIENTKALKHRHVVEFRGSGCSQGTFFFTMEFCDGGSVKDLYKRRRGPLSIPEAGEIVLQALDGLAYAHQAEIPHVQLADGSVGRGRGLVHRDLKPGNLFLSGSSSARIVKVADFGLAKAFDAAGLSGLTCSGNVAGTLAFMPRQQIIRDGFRFAKPEVDVWAMAATLYCLLTGTVPRDFDTGKEVLRVLLEDPAVPIRKRNSKIPARLAEVIDYALREEPEIPFKSAAEFRRALEKVL